METFAYKIECRCYLLFSLWQSQGKLLAICEVDVSHVPVPWGKLTKSHCHECL